jgi:membrane fusion protein, multidrug efflux system
MAEMQQEKQNTADASQPKKPIRSRRSKTLWWFTIGLLLIGLAFFLLWFFYLRFHRWTDNAYANGNLININSAVAGSVVAFFADDTDLVEEGQLLVLLDDTDYAAAYKKELATLASVVLQVRQLYSNVLANQAHVESQRVAVERAQFDYENRLHLIDYKAVSNEEFVHSRDTLLMAEEDLSQANYQWNVSKDAAGNTSPEQHPLIEQQKGAVRMAYYNLKHCAIYAPSTGYVAQRTVDVGQWATPTSNLMAVIPTDYVWVDANYKETQLKKMRIGQPATVKFDLYGSCVKYEGKVLGIASGSGSVFSIIPPQNATGNWIKIVQRLPVRISLDPEKVKQYPTRLGISAEVNVNVTNQDLPMLAQIPPTCPVATTRVFDIHMEEVEKVMDEIIRANFKSYLKTEQCP